MKLKTKELTGRALDYAVAEVEGTLPASFDDWKQVWPSYATRPAGDNIIDREMISTQVYDASFKPEVMWNAYMPGDVPVMADEEINGPTRRIAAMRCWVHHKLGAEVEVPDELVEDA